MQEAGMKKLMVLVLATFLFAATAPAARGKLILNAYGTCLDLPANSFTAQQSQYKVFAEGKASYLVWRNLYVWASYGYFPLRDGWSGWSSKAVFAQDLDYARTLGKRMASGGVGYLVGFLEPAQFAVRGEVGVSSVANAIVTDVSRIASGQPLRSDEARQSGIGLRLNLSVDYGLYKNVFAEISGGYTWAGDTIDTVSSKLGGLHLALGLGIVL
jgi:hypothetical protein